MTEKKPNHANDNGLIDSMEEIYKQGSNPNVITLDQLMRWAPALGSDAVNDILVYNGLPTLDDG